MYLIQLGALYNPRLLLACDWTTHLTSAMVACTARVSSSGDEEIEYRRACSGLSTDNSCSTESLEPDQVRGMGEV